MTQRRKKSTLKVLLAQAIFLIVTVCILIFSLKVFATAAHLFLISDNIHFLEEYSDWNDEDLNYYNELIAERIAVKNESAIGFVLVVAGENLFTQLLRITILIGLFAFDCYLVYLSVSIIKSDFVYLLKKITKKFAKR